MTIIVLSELTELHGHETVKSVLEAGQRLQHGMARVLRAQLRQRPIYKLRGALQVLLHGHQIGQALGLRRGSRRSLCPPHPRY